MIISELFEAPQQCPECGGISFSNLILAEKKDACYHKVKASAKVWPSAYASGRLVQCRKKGAANYGNKSEGVAEGGDVFMANIQNTPEYRAGFATGKLPVPHPEGTQEYANYYKGVIDKASPTLSKMGEDDANFGKSAALMTPSPQAAQQAKDIVQQRADANVVSQAKMLGAVPVTREGEQKKGADYRDPREVDYDDEYDAMVARVKKLAGLGPMKTVYDPNRRVYRNMPTAQQPKK